MESEANQHTYNSLTPRALIDDACDLASTPEIFLRVTEILDDPTKCATEAGKIIENDPGLTSRLLRIVNSSFFAFPSPITTVSRAIPIIGTVELRNLVLATLVIDRFKAGKTGPPSMREFWKSSVRCALYAKVIASHIGSIEDLSSIFVCGLLHNIGTLILFDRIPDQMNQVQSVISASSLGQEQAEYEVLGFDHFAVGAELAVAWGLPKKIEYTIRYHSRPSAATIYNVEAAIVSVSHNLSFPTPNLQYTDAISTARGSRISDALEDFPETLDSLTNQVDSQFQHVFQLINQG